MSFEIAAVVIAPSPQPSPPIFAVMLSTFLAGAREYAFWSLSPLEVFDSFWALLRGEVR
jgi:hypothetical protein